MRTPNRPRAHTSGPSNPARRSVPVRRSRSWQLSPQLLTDAVVAGYIHDISARHGHGTGTRWIRRGRGDQR